MSGQPRYDEYAVLDAAITVFWQHGYASTSVGELTKATGLARSSLYQRFGDKDGLFNEALARYSERVVARMRSIKANSAKTNGDPASGFFAKSYGCAAACRLPAKP
jgi:AcrR family transcriptional regulator